VEFSHGNKAKFIGSLQARYNFWVAAVWTECLIKLSHSSEVLKLLVDHKTFSIKMLLNIRVFIMQNANITLMNLIFVVRASCFIVVK